MINQSALILGLLSLVFAYLSLRDYVHGGYKLSLQAWVWLRIVIIFAVVAAMLIVML